MVEIKCFLSLRIALLTVVLALVFVPFQASLANEIESITLTKEVVLQYPIQDSEELPDKITFSLYESQDAVRPLATQVFSRGQYSIDFDFSKSDGLSAGSVARLKVNFSYKLNLHNLLDSSGEPKELWAELSVGNDVVGVRERIPDESMVKLLQLASGISTPITIGPSFLEVDEGDGVEEPNNFDEPGDPPLSGYTDKAVGHVMAMNSLTAQDFVVERTAKIEFWAPKIVLKPGFHAGPFEGDGYFRAGIPVFYVNCLNLVNPEPLTEYKSVFTDDLPHTVIADGEEYDNFFYVHGNNAKRFREFCENEVAILNHHFANEVGNQLIRFKVKHAFQWRWDMSTSPSSMPTEDDEALYYCLNTGDSSGATMGSSGPCTDKKVLFNRSSFADPEALTMIYFRYPSDAANTSYGDANLDGAPFILVNYRRSDTTLKAPDIGDVNGAGFGNGIRDDDWDRKGVHEHEMGHAFLVHHTWDERVTSSTGSGGNDQLTNIMNYGGSSDNPISIKAGYDSLNNFCKGGLQGNRDVGFWFEPFDGSVDQVCHRWVNGNIDYDGDGSDGDTNAEKAKWSQIELIYYAAKYYKKTWAP
jgi:hypothetical protein